MRHIPSAFIKDPVNTYFNGEDTGEKVLYVLRRHLITNLDWVLIGLALVLTPFFASMIFVSLNVGASSFSPALMFVLLVLWYLFTFGFIFENFLIWFFNVYIITNKRIVDMDFHGLLFRNISDAPHSNIEDITHSISGAAQVIFNYGDVFIQTAADQREFDFNSVPRPARVQDIISDLVAQINSDDS